MTLKSEDSMKTSVLTDIRKCAIREVPDPKIVHDTDVLIRMKRVGICGSDLHYFTTGRIGFQIVKYPFITGHEAAGIVEEVGPGVTRVQAGQRIAIDPSLCCHTCDQCLTGREHTCRNNLFLGLPGQLEGAMSEFIVMPEESCFPIQDAMTFDEAVLTEPLAIAVYAVEKSKIPSNGTAAILGCGPIGMSVFHVLRAQMAGRVYVTEKIPERIEHGKSLDPDWIGNPRDSEIVGEINKREPLGVDVVYECSGDPETIHQAIAILKPGGSLILIGIAEADTVPFPTHELRRKEIPVISIRRQVHCTQKAIDLITSGKTDVSHLATHHFSLEETAKAFDLAANYHDGVMKAMIMLN